MKLRDGTIIDLKILCETVEGRTLAKHRKDTIAALKDAQDALDLQLSRSDLEASKTMKQISELRNKLFYFNGLIERYYHELTNKINEGGNYERSNGI